MCALLSKFFRLVPYRYSLVARNRKNLPSLNWRIACSGAVRSAMGSGCAGCTENLDFPCREPKGASDESFFDPTQVHDGRFRLA